MATRTGEIANADPHAVRPGKFLLRLQRNVNGEENSHVRAIANVKPVGPAGQGGFHDYECGEVEAGRLEQGGQTVA